MHVIIDDHSGFCFGVQFAIDVAEDYLEKKNHLYILGDIVHNEAEVLRLKNKGAEVVSREDFPKLKGETVLLRAHGEPPETYRDALMNDITLMDASCPVVLKLQRRVKDFYKQGYQIIMYGKKSHPETIGIIGQCGGQVIVINSHDPLDPSEIEPIDFTRKTVLLSQTTKSIQGFYTLSDNLKKLFKEKGREENFEPSFLEKNTLCRQVSKRDEILANFSKDHNVIIFVAGMKSSNGKSLFSVCKKHNDCSHFIESHEMLNSSWFQKENGDFVNSVGVCGATSTPRWLMQKVADTIESYQVPVL